MRNTASRIFRGLRLFLFGVIAISFLSVGSGAAWFYAKGWPSSWRAADWSSSGLSQEQAAFDEAVVQVYAARAGGWKSVFAVHSWVVLKQAGERSFTRYEVVGWGRPVRHNAYPADGRWYSNDPQVVFDLRGAEAAALIPRIVAAIDEYPHSERGSYTVWPGPNSNTFVAWLGREIPDLGMELPPTAIGKDYLGDGISVARTPSGSGWQVSWSGYVGAALGLHEGLELHILGSTIGIDPDSLSLKLPSIGTLGPREIAEAAGMLQEAFAEER